MDSNNSDNNHSSNNSDDNGFNPVYSMAISWKQQITCP